MSSGPEWSDAIMASMGIQDESPNLGDEYHQDIQTDFLPTSTQSPRRSPQPPPDSQVKDAITHRQHQQQHSVSQEHFVSQSCGPAGEHLAHGFNQQPLNKNLIPLRPPHAQGSAPRSQQSMPRGPPGQVAQPQARMPRTPHTADGHRPAFRPPLHQSQQRPGFSGTPQPRMSTSSGPLASDIQTMNSVVRQHQPRHPVNPLLSPSKSQPQNIRPPGAQIRPYPPGQSHGQPMHQPGVRPANINNQMMSPRPASSQGFPSSHHIGGAHMEATMYDEEEDYDEEYDDEDYDDEEMEEEEYLYGHQNVSYPDSDSEDISEEESILLEELAFCEDKERYDQIIDHLREKGVNPEELDEIMYTRNMRGMNNQIYDDDDYEDEEDEDGNIDEEELVSSSSQRHMTSFQNTHRFPVNNLGTHNQPRHPTDQILNKPQQSVQQLGQQPSRYLTPGNQSKIDLSQQQGWHPTKVNSGEVRPKVPQSGNSAQSSQKFPVRPQNVQGDKTPGLSSPTGTVKSNQPNLAKCSNQPFTPGPSGQCRPTLQQGPSLSPGSQLSMIRGPPPKPMPLSQPQTCGQMLSQEVNLSQNVRFTSPQPLTRPPRPGAATLRGAQSKETSEASLARLEVEYMQQILDEEIKAKKGFASSNTRHPHPYQSTGTRQPQLQQSPYQPKHQLPPRQPIPAICDPNSSTLLNSGGRPVCSVVPFTQPQAGVGPKSAPFQQQQLLLRNRTSFPLSVQTSPTQAIQQFRGPTTPVLNIQSNITPVRGSTTLVQGNLTRGPAAPSPTLESFTPEKGPVPPVQNSGQMSLHCSYMDQSKAQEQSLAYHHSQQSSSAPHMPQQSSQQHPSQQRPMPQQQPLLQQPAPSQQQLPSAPHMLQQSSQHPSQQRPMPQQQPLLQQPASSQQQLPQQPAALPQNQMTLPQSQNSLLNSTQNQQPPIPSSSKPPENFSLDNLSEGNCSVKSGKSLTKGMVYQIRLPKQTLVYAVWNGEKFEDLHEEDLKAIRSKNVGAGKQTMVTEAAQINSEKSKNITASAPPSKFQAAFIQTVSQKAGNFSSPDLELESHIQEHNLSSEHVHSKNEPDFSNSQTTYVKPLVAAPCERKEEMEEEDDETIFKKPFPEQEDYFRVCKNCGNTSQNFRRCDGCHKVFQGDVKVVARKKPNSKMIAQPMTNKSSSSEETFSSVMDNVSFYSKSPRGRGRGRGAKGAGRTRGGGMKGRSGARGGQDESNSESEDSYESKGSTDGSNSNSEITSKKRSSKQKAKNPTPRKRTKKQDEPVTLTISSDEDEPSSTSSNNLPSQAPSPAHSSGADSPIFPTIPTEPINAFGRFRRVLMEDEEGISKLGKKIQINKNIADQFEEDEDDEDEDDIPIYEIVIRSVRIGSMRTQPEGPLMINRTGLCFKVISERTDEVFECEIMAEEVELVKYFSGLTQPVLFLLLTQECGEKLRQICHMEPGDDEYFDPSSTDMKQKMVVIIIENLNYMPEPELKDTLSLWADMNGMEDAAFIEELSEEEANDLLIQSAPPVLTANIDKNMIKFKRRYNFEYLDSMMGRPPVSPSDSTDNEPDSTSSSPPEVKHFFGANARLLQYPQQRGIPITTEDLYCLNEGEYLNDVIIDFYLQYLYLEKLSPENRERTHIFSSFFYKRLTQRDRHTEKAEEDAKKSLPERRHARVKKWTKTVDLFSKDFIIVPINEHSHWYLAVICFPGLAGPEPVFYLPNTSHLGDKESPDNPGAEEENKTNNSQETPPRTIFGCHLAHGVVSDEAWEGVKQPCILMFDSLAGPSRNPNIKMLREYLQCEWNAKKIGSEPRNISKIIRGSCPRVPQQSNYSDCGIYILQYVESFFEDPIGDFQIPMKGLQNWFPMEKIQYKRQNIHELIMTLHRRYQEERGETRILDIKYDSMPREPAMKKELRPEECVNMGTNREDDNSNSSMSTDCSAQPPHIDNFLLDPHSDNSNCGQPGSGPDVDGQNFSSNEQSSEMLSSK